MARAELETLPFLEAGDPGIDDGSPAMPSVRPEEDRKGDVAAIAEGILLGTAFLVGRRFPKVLVRAVSLRGYVPRACEQIAESVAQAGVLPIHAWLFWAGLAARGLRFVGRLVLDEAQVRISGGTAPAPSPNAQPESA